jgi:hypothetical protein
MSLEDLRDSGANQMTEAEIHDFLVSEGVGILGVPSEGAPYIIPMSFGYDGESSLYFTFFLGASSRKETLCERADAVSFLVYRAKSLYNWESVVLTGTIEAVPDDQWDVVRDAMRNAWHPQVFENAEPERGISGYQFRIEHKSGLRYTGVPPRFEREQVPDRE